MGQLVAWYNLIFAISLGVGLLLLVGSAFGLVSHDFDLDGHPEVGGPEAGGHELGDHAAADGHAHPPGSSPLDVGRVPFTLLLLMAALIFGTAGFLSNVALRGTLGSPRVYGWISLAVAALAAVLLTRALARLLLRYLPPSESYNVDKHSFRGCSAELTVACDPTFGAANLTDREGNLHTITCRTESGTLPKGTLVVVVDYLPDQDVCVVQAESEIAAP